MKFWLGFMDKMVERWKVKIGWKLKISAFWSSCLKKLTMANPVKWWEGNLKNYHSMGVALTVAIIQGVTQNDHLIYCLLIVDDMVIMFTLSRAHRQCKYDWLFLFISWIFMYIYVITGNDF